LIQEIERKLDEAQAEAVRMEAYCADASSPLLTQRRALAGGDGHKHGISNDGNDEDHFRGPGVNSIL